MAAVGRGRVKTPIGAAKVRDVGANPPMDRIEYVKEGFLDPDCRRERLDSEDSHRSLQVVCKHVQAHLSTHSRQCLGQEVRCTHPRFEGTERMFHRLSADP